MKQINKNNEIIVINLNGYKCNYCEYPIMNEYDLVTEFYLYYDGFSHKLLCDCCKEEKEWIMNNCGYKQIDKYICENQN